MPSAPEEGVALPSHGSGLLACQFPGSGAWAPGVRHPGTDPGARRSQWELGVSFVCPSSSQDCHRTEMGHVSNGKIPAFSERDLLY